MYVWNIDKKKITIFHLDDVFHIAMKDNITLHRHIIHKISVLIVQASIYSFLVNSS